MAVDVTQLHDRHFGKHVPDAVTKHGEDLSRTAWDDIRDLARVRTGKPSERDSLTAACEKSSLTASAKKAFLENMNLFEERCLYSQHPLDQTEITRTYQQLERLFKSPGNPLVHKNELNSLACQIMSQAAEPASVTQGDFNTCNVTTVQSRIYTLHPSAAARLVADVATTGRYLAADGTHVNVLPVDIKADPAGVDTGRNHASKIFQVTAINIFYQRAEPNVTYVQQVRKEGASYATTEGLFDYSKLPARQLSKTPDLWPENLYEINNQITGKKEFGFILTNKDAPAGGTVKVGSEAQLGATLQVLKHQGKLPAILEVNCLRFPFYRDSSLQQAEENNPNQAFKANQEWHVVTITDYDPRTRLVSVVNQWGRDLNHLGPDAVKMQRARSKGRIPLHMLYDATSAPADKDEH